MWVLTRLNTILSKLSYSLAMLIVAIMVMALSLSAITRYISGTGYDWLIELPPISWDWDNQSSFYARVNMPNGASQDDYTINDLLTSDYEYVEEYPGTFAMWFRTNNFPNESSYEIRNNLNELIFSV